MSKKRKDSINAISELTRKEFDSEINKDNYKEFGIPLTNYDEQLLSSLVGSNYNLVPNKIYTNTAHKNISAKEQLYNTHIWVGKEIYSNISKVTNRYNLSLAPDTIILAVLIIEKAYLKTELLKIYNAKEIPLSEEQKTILEIGNFVEVMREIANSNSKNSLIDIFINGSRVLVSDGNIVMNEILKWHHSYYNKERAAQYFYDALKYQNVKNKVQPTSNIYISAMADFKKISCQLLYDNLNKLFKKPADSINFIAEILAARNIFGLNKLKTKSKYDTVYRAINSEYRNIY